MPETAAPGPDDRSLLSCFRQEPARWLPAVLERYERPLLRHAGSVLADPVAAQDVVQECFLRLLANGQPVDNLSAWLHRVTHNLAVDHLRAESRRQRLHAAAAHRACGGRAVGGRRAGARGDAGPRRPRDPGADAERARGAASQAEGGQVLSRDQCDHRPQPDERRLPHPPGRRRRSRRASRRRASCGGSDELRGRPGTADGRAARRSTDVRARGPARARRTLRGLCGRGGGDRPDARPAARVVVAGGGRAGPGRAHAAFRAGDRAASSRPLAGGRRVARGRGGGGGSRGARSAAGARGAARRRPSVWPRPKRLRAYPIRLPCRVRLRCPPRRRRPAPGRPAPPSPPPAVGCHGRACRRDRAVAGR